MRIWDIPHRRLCRSHLLGEHRELHAVWSILTRGKKGYSRHPETLRWRGRLKALFLRHERLVLEMRRRGYRHCSPLDRRLATGRPVQDRRVDSPARQLEILKAKGCRCAAGARESLGKLAARVQKPEWELKIERVIGAPISRVFEAWAKPEQVARWFAPQPLTLEVKKMEFRPGGTFEMAMVWPDGEQRHDFGGTYVEIIPQKRIVWTGEFPGDPKDNIRTEVDFAGLGGKTKISARQVFFVRTDINRGRRQGANQGWNMTLHQLSAFVAERKS